MIPKQPIHPGALRPGSVIKSPYILLSVDQMLMADQNSITYIASAEMPDNAGIRRRVAFHVREFFPSYCRRADDGRSLLPPPGAEQAVMQGRQSFLAEENFKIGLSHASDTIAPVLEMFEANGTAYSVAEAPAAKLPAGIPEFDALKIILDIAAAVDTINSKGWSHLGLSPYNVKMKADGKTPAVLISGMSVANCYARPGQLAPMAQIVDPQFLPSEHFFGVNGFSPRFDVYSLGALLLYMLSGKQLPAGNMVSFSQQEILSIIPPVNPATGNAILRAMRPNPADRIPDTRQLIAELSAALKVVDQQRFAPVEPKHAKAKDEEAEARRKAEEAEARRKAEEAEARRKAEEAEARRKAEEAEARRKAEEAEARRKAEEAEARRKAEEAEARRKAEEAEARRKAEGALAKATAAHAKELAEIEARREAAKKAAADKAAREAQLEAIRIAAEKAAEEDRKNYDKEAAHWASGFETPLKPVKPADPRPKKKKEKEVAPVVIDRPATDTDKNPKSKRPIYIAGAVILAAILGSAAYFLIFNNGSSSAEPKPAPVDTLQQQNPDETEQITIGFEEEVAPAVSDSALRQQPEPQPADQPANQPAAQPAQQQPAAGSRDNRNNEANRPANQGNDRPAANTNKQKAATIASQAQRALNNGSNMTDFHKAHTLAIKALQLDNTNQTAISVLRALNSSNYEYYDYAPADKAQAAPYL